MLQVVNRAGGRSQVENIVNFAEIEGLADILLHKFEARVIIQMLNIRPTSSQQIVGTHDGMALRQQRVAQMRANKARPACHQYAHISFVERPVDSSQSENSLNLQTTVLRAQAQPL